MIFIPVLDMFREETKLCLFQCGSLPRAIDVLLSYISHFTITFFCTCSQGRGQFPCDASVLEIHGNDFGWSADMTSLSASPLLIHDDGAVVYYRCGK